MRMARAEAGCVRSACTTRSRTMAIRLTLLTTEWLLLHCEAHTAKPKIGVKDTDSPDLLLPKSAGGFGRWRDAQITASYKKATWRVALQARWETNRSETQIKHLGSQLRMPTLGVSTARAMCWTSTPSTPEPLPLPYSQTVRGTEKAYSRRSLRAAAHCHVNVAAPRNPGFQTVIFAGFPPGMGSVHPHNCRLCGWTESLPGGMTV